MFWLKHKTSRDTPLVTERQLSSFFAFVRHNNKDRESVHLLPFSRRFRRKTRLLHWLVFFHQFNAIGPLFVHYAILPLLCIMHLVLHFQRTQSL